MQRSEDRDVLVYPTRSRIDESRGFDPRRGSATGSRKETHPFEPSYPVHDNYLDWRASRALSLLSERELTGSRLWARAHSLVAILRRRKGRETAASRSPLSRTLQRVDRQSKVYRKTIPRASFVASSARRKNGSHPRPVPEIHPKPRRFSETSNPCRVPWFFRIASMESGPAKSKRVSRASQRPLFFPRRSRERQRHEDEQRRSIARKGLSVSENSDRGAEFACNCSATRKKDNDEAATKVPWKPRLVITR